MNRRIFMKKIIVGILGLALLITAAPNVSAASVWNGASNDCKGLSILNATTNNGYAYPCWPETSIGADAGDTLNVRVYYHNTGSTAANNTKVTLNAQLGSASTNKSFSGSISSDQGGLSLGSVTANLSSSQTLTFNSVKWYTNNTSETLTPLLNGQSGSEILNGGLDIGSIAPGWATQGSLVVSFHVSNTTAPQLCQDSTATNYGGSLPCTYAAKACVINSFYSNPSTITLGGSSTLTWDTTNCVSANISQIGSVNVNGTNTVSPAQTTSYLLTAYGSNGVPQTRYETVTVSQVQKICSLNSFTANPTSVVRGGLSTLDWSTTNCDSVTISNLGYQVPVIGSQSVYPTVTTTYVLVASGVNGINTQTKSVTITVNNVQTCQDSAATNYGGALPCQYPAKICSIDNFTTSPASITKGDYSTLNWNTTNCDNVTISNLSYSLPVDGSQPVYPSATTTYTLTARDSSGVVAPIKSVTVYVSVNQVCEDPSASNYHGSLPCTYPPQVCKDTTATNYGGALPCKYPPQNICVVNSFTAVPVSINKGGTSTLNWNTTNCDNVIISNLSYSLPTTGAQDVYPTQTITYTLTARSASGAMAPTKTATVYVSNNQICEDPSANNYHGSLPCRYPVVQICQDYTATNYGGILPCRYIIIIPTTNNCRITNFSASDTSISSGDSVTLDWDTDNCERVKISNIGSVSDSGSKRVYPSSDTTYLITGYNADGSHESDTLRINVDDNNNNNNNCSIDSFTANNTYINRNDPVTLRWNTSDCDNVNISNIGNVNEDGSKVVYPNETTTYLLRAYGNNTVTRYLQINVNNNQILPPVQILNTNVVTTVATNVTQTTAQINGLITSTNYNNSNVYFEYGTDVVLGSRTAAHTTNGNTNFSDYLTNLSPNTIYYFQAVASGTNGISRGAIEIFRTPGYNTVNTNTNINTNNTNTQTTRRVIVQQGTTIAGSESPIVLRIENKYQTIGVGDIIDYVVYYKNISSSILTHPMIQVTIPQGITLINSSRGTYSQDDRILSAPIEDLYPDAEGVIYIQARVDTIDSTLAQIVTTAVLVYTNPNGAQENTMAYVLNNPRMNGSVLGASAFFGGSFLGLNLIGWLIIIILILLLVLAARNYNGRRDVVYYPNHNTTPHN